MSFQLNRIKIPCKNNEYYFELHITTDLLNCDACVCPKYYIDSISGQVIKGSIGNVYFKPDSFQCGVIAHEALHMALAYIRIVEVLPQLGEECDDAEEKVAYHTGWFAARLGETFWELKESNYL